MYDNIIYYQINNIYDYELISERRTEQQLKNGVFFFYYCCTHMVCDNRLSRRCYTT